MQKRNVLISFLQVFGIILVVAGHSDYQIPDNPVHRWIYSFHMPLFMFISGYLLRYGLREKSLATTSMYGAKGFIWKKVRRLLIPYVFISSLAFFPKAWMSRFAARPLDVSWDSYLNMLIYPWDNVIIFFWFLPTLFIIFLIVVYSAKLLAKLRITVPWGILLLILVGLHLFNPMKGFMLLNIGGVINYLLYFGLGYYCCRNHLEQYFQRNPVVLFAGTFVLSLVLPFLPKFFAQDVLMAINGIAMSICLGHLYVRTDSTFLAHLYGSSYAIYLFSWFPQVAFQQVLMKLTGAPWPVTSALALIGGIYIPWLIYRWILKNKENRAGRVVAYLTGQ